jgi:hypothetical protein
MALTLISEPKLHQPAYNPLNLQISSNLSGNPNFRYFTEVTVANVKRAEFFDIPRPVNGNLWKDVHRVVEVFVPRGYGALTTGVQLENNVIDYKVKVTEFSGSISGAVYETPIRLANLMALSWEDFITNKYDDYVFTASAGKFRTKRNNIKIAKDEVYSLSWISTLLTTTDSAINRIQVTPFDAAGDLTPINFTDADQGDTNPFNAYKNIKIGFNFNSMPSNAIGFRVAAQNQSNANVGDPIVFLLNDECSRTQPIRLIWLNRLGGYDAYTFNANPEFMTMVERENYSRIIGPNYTLSQHRELTLTTKYTNEIALRSQWINDEESRAIEELVTSPVAFWDKGAGVLLPINVLEDSYTTRYRAKDRLFDATLRIKLSFDNQTQRR